MAFVQSLKRVRNVCIDALPNRRVIRRGPGAVRRVALTFDDGPGDSSRDLLDTLDHLGVPATFFLVGDQALHRPTQVREYVRRGHQIAGHGWDHRPFPELSPLALGEQLRRTEQALGPQPTRYPWVRPPYGKLSATSAATVLAHGYTLALWSYDSFDHTLRNPAEIVSRMASASLGPGEILLFHEGQEWTLEALPGIVERLRADGLECVTMADLFAE